MEQIVVRALVVDDTVVYRKIVTDILQSIEGVEVVASASNGKSALQKIHELSPDIVTLDLEMPVMDGLQTLEALKDSPAGNRPGVIMLSAFTTEGANATVKALELGAFDFILKPASGDIQKNVESLRQELGLKIRACMRSRQVRSLLQGLPNRLAVRSETQTRRIPPAPVAPSGTISPLRKKPQVVTIGISTGGPQALTKILPLIPGDFPIPILIVQHMPPMFTKSLADDLNRRCPMQVYEAQHDQPIVPGAIYIAPGGKQMKAHLQQDKYCIKITDDPPENSCKPAVDYLFRSVAHAYDGQAIAVVMTGMGSDGTLGCRLLKRAGATIITQNEATCTVYGMPRMPAEEGLSDYILPLMEIPTKIVQMTQHKVYA